MPDHPVSTELAKWINQELDPNVYIVATLKPSIDVKDIDGVKRIYANEHDYGIAYIGFLKKFSQRIYGKSCWRRHKRLFPNAATLEGNGYGMALKLLSKESLGILMDDQSGRPSRYHLNIMMRRPDWISFEDFEALFRDVWSENPWAQNPWNEKGVYIKPRTDDCTVYSLKEGPVTLFAASLSF